MSTHYTRYDPGQFAVNFAALLVQLVAKLPLMHGVRILGINSKTAPLTAPVAIECTRRSSVDQIAANVEDDD